MSVLGHLEPKKVFGFFEEMCAIPHGSYNNTAMSNWLVKFAADRGLEHYQDAAENVIISKPATPGYEQAEPVIIQGHMDMVCEKAAGCTKDMAKEGLDLAVDGDYVYAKGTTLGGDDGIAVAMGLALLDSDDVAHPRLEVVITTDEEINMGGAAALDASVLQAHRMLNIDSEEEGVFTVSCAGGTNADIAVPVKRENFAGVAVTVSVDGLIGGHSGIEIDRGRGNADMILGRILLAASQESALRVVRVDGGLKGNAIPAAAKAVVVAEDADAFKQSCGKMAEALRAEYVVTDPGIRVTVTEGGEGMPMDEVSTQRVIGLLACAPNGVQVMSADVPGLVQSSLNLGVLYTEEDTVHAQFCIRSSVESGNEMINQRLICLAGLLGAECRLGNYYPGWAYRQESPLRDLMTEVYAEQYGAQPRIEAIHAGLECGLFAGKITDLDCVSFGPNLIDIHTPRERMSIASVQRTWAFIVELLRRMK